MTHSLQKLSAADLRDLASALRSGRLCPPYHPLGVKRILDGGTATEIATHLQDLADIGFGIQQIATTLELIASDRESRLRIEDVIDLVTTGPEARGVANRDTSVVVRELFAGAMESVLVAGFAIYQGQLLFQALADRMRERPQLKVRMYVDIQRPFGDTTQAADLVRRYADRFRNRQWPLGRAVPEVYFDPRSLAFPGEKRACMHAKCVAVDRRSVFISSANFTEAAQWRNIEVGVLIHSPSVAERLTLFFDSMLDEGLFASVF